MSEQPIEGDQPVPGPGHALTVRRPLLRSPWRLTAAVLSGALGVFLLVRLAWFLVDHPLAILMPFGVAFFFRNEARAVIARRGWRTPW